MQMQQPRYRVQYRFLVDDLVPLLPLSLPASSCTAYVGLVPIHSFDARHIYLLIIGLCLSFFPLYISLVSGDRSTPSHLAILFKPLPILSRRSGTGSSLLRD